MNQKYKAFEYRTGLKWEEKRRGISRSEGKKDITVAAPPEFKGEPGLWTPEDLFVASVEICTMTTFFAFAERKQLLIHSYESSATGKLEFVDGGYRFTEITLTPRIEIDGSQHVEAVREVMDNAHHKCLIANSVRTTVHVHPEIIIRETA